MPTIFDDILNEAPPTPVVKPGRTGGIFSDIVNSEPVLPNEHPELSSSDPALMGRPRQPSANPDDPKNYGFFKQLLYGAGDIPIRIEEGISGLTSNNKNQMQANIRARQEAEAQSGGVQNLVGQFGTWINPSVGLATSAGNARAESLTNGGSELEGYGRAGIDVIANSLGLRYGGKLGGAISNKAGQYLVRPLAERIGPGATNITRGIAEQAVHGGGSMAGMQTGQTGAALARGDWESAKQQAAAIPEAFVTGAAFGAGGKILSGLIGSFRERIGRDPSPSEIEQLKQSPDYLAAQTFNPANGVDINQLDRQDFLAGKTKESRRRMRANGVSENQIATGQGIQVNQGDPVQQFMRGREAAYAPPDVPVAAPEAPRPTIDQLTELGSPAVNPASLDTGFPDTMEGWQRKFNADKAAQEAYQAPAENPTADLEIQAAREQQANAILLQRQREEAALLRSRNISAQAEAEARQQGQFKPLSPEDQAQLERGQKAGIRQQQRAQDEAALQQAATAERLDKELPAPELPKEVATGLPFAPEDVRGAVAKASNQVEKSHTEVMQDAAADIENTYRARMEAIARQKQHGLIGDAQAAPMKRKAAADRDQEMQSVMQRMSERIARGEQPVDVSKEAPVTPKPVEPQVVPKAPEPVVQESAPIVAPKVETPKPLGKKSQKIADYTAQRDEKRAVLEQERQQKITATPADINEQLMVEGNKAKEEIGQTHAAEQVNELAQEDLGNRNARISRPISEAAEEKFKNDLINGTTSPEMRTLIAGLEDGIGETGRLAKTSKGKTIGEVGPAMGELVAASYWKRIGNSDFVASWTGKEGREVNSLRNAIRRAASGKPVTGNRSGAERYLLDHGMDAIRGVRENPENVQPPHVINEALGFAGPEAKPEVKPVEQAKPDRTAEIVAERKAQQTELPQAVQRRNEKEAALLRQVARRAQLTKDFLSNKTDPNTGKTFSGPGDVVETLKYLGEMIASHIQTGAIHIADIAGRVAKAVPELWHNSEMQKLFVRAWNEKHPQERYGEDVAKPLFLDAFKKVNEVTPKESANAAENNQRLHEGVRGEEGQTSLLRDEQQAESKPGNVQEKAGQKETVDVAHGETVTQRGIRERVELRKARQAGENPTPEENVQYRKGEREAREAVDKARREAYEAGDPVNVKKVAKEGGFRQAMREVHELILRTFAPQKATIQAGIVAGRIRDFNASKALLKKRNAVKFAKAMKQWNKLTPEDGTAFILRMDEGARQPTKELQDFADTMKELLDAKREQINKQTGKLEHFYKDYVPHLFKDTPAAREYFGKASLEGNKGFLKERSFRFYKDALDHGLELKYTNPVELLLSHLEQTDKFLLADELFAGLKKDGLTEFVGVDGLPTNDNWVKIDDKIAQVWNPPNEEGKFTKHGDYYAPAEVAQVLNNYLTPGYISKFKLLRGYMYFKTAVTMSELGLSPYHMFTTAVASMGTTLGRVLGDVQDRRFGRAAGNLLLASTGVGPAIKHYYMGRRYRAEYNKKGTHPELTDIVQRLVEGGMIGDTHPEYKNQSIGRMAESFRKGIKGVPKGLAHTPFAALEAASKPIMEHWVPNLKWGAAGELARRELERLPHDATPDDVRKAMYGVVATVDNRFGEMNRDNLFWNKNAQDTAYLVTRAISWSQGQVQGLGGGALDISMQLKNLMTGKKAQVTHNIEHLVGQIAASAIIGATTTYILTGKGPQDLKDYFFPRSGEIGADGKPIRYDIPGHMKDIWHYATHPIKTVIGKEDSLSRTIYEMMTNKDFFDQPIRNVNDPLGKQLEDSAKHIGKMFVPISIKNAQKAAQEGRSTGAQTAAFMGFNKTPSYLNQSKAEETASEILNTRHFTSRLTPEQRAARNGIAQALRNGESGRADELAKAALDGGVLTEKQIKYVRDAAENPSLVNQIRSLSPEEAMSVWDAATPEEQDQLREPMALKVMNARSLSDEQRTEFFGKIHLRAGKAKKKKKTGRTRTKKLSAKKHRFYQVA